MAADFIGKQFKYQRIGQVSRVDLLKKQTPQGFDYFIAFVHFSEWFDTPQAKALQDEIHTDGAKAKLQFHERWYWIVNENKTPLTATEASLHKTIYEQAKQIGLLNEAVDYLKSMKSVTTAVAEAVLQRTAQVGFGNTWSEMMNPPTLTRQQTLVSPEVTWNTAENFPPLWSSPDCPLPSQEGPLHLPPTPELEEGEIPLSPPPLLRSIADGTVEPLSRTYASGSPYCTPARNPQPHDEAPPAPARTRSSMPQGRRLTPRDLFGANAAPQWPQTSAVDN
jgi:hypothetical protein